MARLVVILIIRCRPKVVEACGRRQPGRGEWSVDVPERLGVKFVASQLGTRGQLGPSPICLL